MSSLKYIVGNIYKDLILLEELPLKPMGKQFQRNFECECSCGLILERDILAINQVGNCGIRGRHKKYIKKLDYIELQISNGEYTKMDIEDFERVRNYSWTYSDGYAKTTILERGVSLHRFILGYKGELEVDHKNRDRLDNRKNNLRICSRKDNQHNSFKGGQTTGLRNIYKEGKKYRVRFFKNGKKVHLGMFEDIKDAIKIYNNYVIKEHGDYAYLQ